MKSVQWSIILRLSFGIPKPTVLIVSAVYLAWACKVCAAPETGVYQTSPETSVQEHGDRVPNGSRVVPFSATLTINSAADQPSLTAVIPNAVLEGGDPFLLTVHSSFGVRLIDGTFEFRGDYLQDTVPSGSQYLFDWKFSPSTGGSVTWNGIIGWTGGHVWQVNISDVTIQTVPEPSGLSLLAAGFGILFGVWKGRKMNRTSYAVQDPTCSSKNG